LDIPDNPAPVLPDYKPDGATLAQLKKIGSLAVIVSSLNLVALLLEGYVFGWRVLVQYPRLHRNPPAYYYGYFITFTLSFILCFIFWRMGQKMLSAARRDEWTAFYSPFKLFRQWLQWVMVNVLLQLLLLAFTFAEQPEMLRW
jgi:hypothetical protein